MPVLQWDELLHKCSLKEPTYFSKSGPYIMTYFADDLILCFKRSFIAPVALSILFFDIFLFCSFMVFIEKATNI